MSEYQAGYEAGRIDAELDRVYYGPGHSMAWLRGYNQAWRDAGKQL